MPYCARECGNDNVATRQTAASQKQYRQHSQSPHSGSPLVSGRGSLSLCPRCSLWFHILDSSTKQVAFIPCRSLSKSVDREKINHRAHRDHRVSKSQGIVVSVASLPATTTTAIVGGRRPSVRGRGVPARRRPRAFPRAVGPSCPGNEAVRDRRWRCDRRSPRPLPGCGST